MVTDDDIAKLARPMWDAAQRLGMQIAMMPPKDRKAAFEDCEISARETFKQAGLTPVQLEAFVDMQMQAIRGMVQNIDLGGSPKGGTA